MNFELNTILLYGAAAGVFSALAGFMLDTLMDFGHILWPLRHWAAKRAAKKLGDQEFINLLNGAKEWRAEKGATYHDLVDFAAEIYEQLSVKRPYFRAWVCSLCLSLRILSVLTLIVFFISIDFTTALGVFIVGAPSAHFVISRI